MSNMKTFVRRAKLFVMIAAVMVVLIVVFQNTAPVAVELLLWVFEPPLVVLLLALLVIGFVAGLLVARRFWKGQPAKEEAATLPVAAEPAPKAPAKMEKAEEKPEGKQEEDGGGSETQQPA